MLTIEYKRKLKELNKKLIKYWYFLMKPLAKLLTYIDRKSYERIKNMNYKDKKIKKYLSKIIQKWFINYSELYLINDYIFNVSEDFYQVYNVEDLFTGELGWDYKNKYLKHYKIYNKEFENVKNKKVSFIDRWLPIIIDICRKNGLSVLEIDKSELLIDNEYLRYNDCYQKINKIYKIKLEDK